VSELGEFAMWLAIGAGQIAFWAAMAPVIGAFAHRIRGHRPTDEAMQLLESRLAALEERGSVSGEVEAQYGRIAELEERLDFAERMLAERTEVAPLPKGTLQ
jgi:hypothetical protein